MKRKTLLLFLLAAMLTVAAYAADTKTVRVDELNLSVDVPSKYTAITQDSDSYALSDGIEETQQWMKDNQFYLLLDSGNPRFGCWLRATPNPLERIDQFDDAVLEEELERQKSRIAEQWASVSSAALFHTDRTVFFRIEGSARDSDGNLVQTLVYATIYDHQNLVFTVQYQGEKMPEHYRTLGDNIIASLRFGADPAPVPVAEPTEFRDSATGASFTVPAGWVTVEPDSGDYYDAEHPPLTFAGFLCSDNAADVQYVCIDLMEQLPDLIGKLLPRDRVDQEHVSIEVIKKSIPYDVRSAQTQTVGGREYYILEIAGTAEADGVEEAFTVTDAFFIRDGYEYRFQFSGTADHPSYADFLSMLETADFPEVVAEEEAREEAAEEDAEAAAEQELAETAEEAPEVETPDEPAPAEKKNHSLPFLLGFAAGRIALLLAVVGIVLAVNARRRKKRAFRTAVPAKRECAACGADLAPGETVCPYCGSKAE